MRACRAGTSSFRRNSNMLGLTQLAGGEPHIWRVIGQNTPYMAVGMTQLGPNCVTPTCIDQPPAFVASHPTGGLPSRPGDYASHESIYDCLHDGVTQTSQKYLLHYQQLSQLRRFQARVAVRVPDLSTSVGSPSRLLAVACAGFFARTSQARAPTSDGPPTPTAPPQCLPQVLCATSSHTALDCPSAPGLSLTDDEQSPG
jgi:hypothetical protein